VSVHVAGMELDTGGPNISWLTMPHTATRHHAHNIGTTTTQCNRNCMHQGSGTVRRLTWWHARQIEQACFPKCLGKREGRTVCTFCIVYKPIHREQHRERCRQLHTWSRSFYALGRGRKQRMEHQPSLNPACWKRKCWKRKCRHGSVCFSGPGLRARLLGNGNRSPRSPQFQPGTNYRDPCRFQEAANSEKC
jgi:hypothetical protein